MLFRSVINFFLHFMEAILSYVVRYVDSTEDSQQPVIRSK